MHNNYYFLRLLSEQLKQELIGYKIGDIFSQAKNELIITLFSRQEERHIMAHLDPAFCCLSFPDLFNRARRNSVDLFAAIIDHEIIDVVKIEDDRSFYFQLDDGFQLLFKMHGNRSNLILLHQYKIVEVFKNNLKQDFKIKIDDLAGRIRTDRASFEKAHGNYKELIPTFGKSFNLYFKHKKYDHLESEDQYKCLLDLLEYLKDPELFLHEKTGKLPQLNLYKIHPEDTYIQKPTEALNSFYRKYISTFQLEKHKSLRRSSINTQIKKGKSYIEKSSAKLVKLSSALNYRHIGDLIMANLHVIKPHTSEITLTDFYSQKPVRIQLKSILSPQLNAEKYYKKAKKQQLEIDTLNKNIGSKEAFIEGLRNELDNLEQISSFKQIGKKAKPKVDLPDLPYHQVKLMDYEILIGKNATKNEKLTFQIAKKDDLFLHAKDAAGSHVIIKKKSNQNFPQLVIEKAASFAAFYSKNNSAAHCRVLYTPKKYVRKAKGAPAGAVIVEREKVILVKPEKIKSKE